MASGGSCRGEAPIWAAGLAVRRTNAAMAHLVAIHEHMALDPPRYASRVADRITAPTRQIGRFPLSGQSVPEYGASCP